MRLGAFELKRRRPSPLEDPRVIYIPVDRGFLAEVNDRELGPLFVTIAETESGFGTLVLRAPNHADMQRMVGSRGMQ